MQYWAERRVVNIPGNAGAKLFAVSTNSVGGFEGAQQSQQCKECEQVVGFQSFEAMAWRGVHSAPPSDILRLAASSDAR